jgi:hypothetical protein
MVAGLPRISDMKKRREDRPRTASGSRGPGGRLSQRRAATGKIGVVGVYEPSDEGAATDDARHGRYDFD